MLCIPAMGHLNPFVSLASGLAKHKNLKIIMYGNMEHKELIESANVEFRNLEIKTENDPKVVREWRKSFPIDKLMSYFLDSAENVLPELIRCVQEEEIDLIIYDFVTVYAKWLVRYLDIQHEKGRLSRPPPKRIMCSASFMQEQGVYPNQHEMRYQIMPKFSVSLLIGLLIFYIRYFFFCRKYEIKFSENLFNLAFLGKERLNLCYVVPELQPRAHLFPKNVKFIGSCAGELDLELKKSLKNSSNSTSFC